MPPLPGFSDNPFITREDVIRASKALLGPLHTYKSPLGARVKIPVETGTHFDETAAQLEGYARPLWVVGCLLAGSGEPEVQGDQLLSWPEGLIAGTDPSLDKEYWGEVGDRDQRMVEMEIISFALLSAPTAFWPPDALTATNEGKAKAQENKRKIIAWFQGINGKDIPQNNWLWFRVLTNLALTKTCGVPYSSLKDAIAADLKILDTFEREGDNGWNSDGPWSDGGRQADYYSGSFAIQYSQLLFVKFASDIDPVRAEKYKRRAGQFALDFLGYFDADGAAIPFGRSLTYRFAMGGFWSVVALAEVSLPAPFDKLGVIKGLLLRHLRYWAKKPSIFHADGTLNIGYAFPNAYMSEDYNSPQSVYWCLKTLVAMRLPAKHPFWTCKELPHPLAVLPGELKVASIEAPLQITCNSGHHHFLLSSGQFCSWPIKGTEAKYGKFAYSSVFGFSVPTGTLLQQIAPDSTLALSNDGEDSWRVRWKSQNARIESLDMVESDGRITKLPILKSTWKPWKVDHFEVETTLIPPTARWPDWHIRVHKVSWIANNLPVEEQKIIAMEGGFAILGRERATGLGVPKLTANLTKEGATEISHEGMVEEQGMALVLSSAGASGIRNLAQGSTSLGVALKPDSNTNLISQRTLIPMLKESLKFGGTGAKRSHILISGVFAIGAKPGGSGISSDELKGRWEAVPRVSVLDRKGIEEVVISL